LLGPWKHAFAKLTPAAEPPSSVKFSIYRDFK
jgi:hypothetical protein